MGFLLYTSIGYMLLSRDNIPCKSTSLRKACNICKSCSDCSLKRSYRTCVSCRILEWCWDKYYWNRWSVCTRTKSVNRRCSTVWSWSCWIYRNLSSHILIESNTRIDTAWKSSSGTILVAIRILEECTESCNDLTNMRDTSSITRTSKITSHRRKESSSEYTDDRDNDHKFHKGKTTRREFHRKNEKK